jgi:RNA polymerase sigma-70 factor (ECF subfamily)
VAIDEAMLLACHARLEKPLHNVLYRWLWDAHECQDVSQEAFLAIWDRRARVEPSTLDALAWTTALNLAKNRLRWQRLRRLVALDDEVPTTAAPAGDGNAGDALAVREALGRLDAKQRDVVLLSEIGGLTTNEIAAVLGVPPGTVGSRKHHALARLRELLGGRDDD